MAVSQVDIATAIQVFIQLFQMALGKSIFRVDDGYGFVIGRDIRCVVDGIGLHVIQHTQLLPYLHRSIERGFSMALQKSDLRLVRQ